MLNWGKIIFKLVVPVYLCVLIFLAAGCSTVNSAHSPNSNKAKERTLLFDNQVSFVPPAGFKPLTKEQYQRSLPENDPPLGIFGNENGSAFVRIHVDEDFSFEPEHLAEYKTLIENLTRKNSGWLTSEIIEINGRKWFHFEAVSQPVDDTTLVAPVTDPDEKPTPAPEVKDKRPFRYRDYGTVFDKKILRFVYEAEAETYPHIKEAFNKSIQTIQVKIKSNSTNK